MEDRKREVRKKENEINKERETKKKKTERGKVRGKGKINKQTSNCKYLESRFGGGLFRACLHGGGGPRVGEVTSRLGGVTRLSI